MFDISIIYCIRFCKYRENSLQKQINMPTGSRSSGARSCPRLALLVGCPRPAPSPYPLACPLPAPCYLSLLLRLPRRGPPPPARPRLRSVYVHPHTLGRPRRHVRGRHAPRFAASALLPRAAAPRAVPPPPPALPGRPAPALRRPVLRRRRKGLRQPTGRAPFSLMPLASLTSSLATTARAPPPTHRPFGRGRAD